MDSSRGRAGVALAAIALAGGCGVHPGAAADVNGTRIDLDEVDGYTAALCDASTAFAEAQPNASGAQPVGRQELRAQVVGVLVRLELARDAADELGVEVSPADIAIDESDLPPVVQELDGDQQDTLLELFAKSQELSAIHAAIGQEVDPEGATPDPVAAGQEYVAEKVSGAEITLDPRIGLDSDLEASTESLSVSAGDEPELPPTQTCG
ncbi:MAG: SurA N-terminal domain-containing protein [Actinomycetota bacterium]|nr:SurA N-terminal domain-containing protein [Actinomycetota bacterium]